jgi:transcriptional regulator with XRE-family HTH domain
VPLISELISSLPWYKKLEILRVIHGWSQEETAKKCGTIRKNYWLWETGQTMPRYNSKRAIAIAFKVTIIEIFDVSKIRKEV